MNEDKDKVVIGRIYILLFPSGKRYVGQTIQTIEERMSQHMSDAKRGCSFLVHKAIRKYSQESIKIEKVFILKCTQEYLDLIEDRTIIAFNTLTPNGYNLKRGGGHGAHSEETKAKMVVIRARRGPVLEDTKTKMSAAHKGKRLSEKTITKRSTARRGRHHSKESRAKMSASKTGCTGCFTGKHHSEETKAKISKALQGRCYSEETKAKMSTARKAYFASRNLKPTSKVKEE